MNNQQETLSELISSLQNSIDDMKTSEKINASEIPSDFEILIDGIKDSSAIGTLFSPKIDKLIASLFTTIENGNFEKILEKKDMIEGILSTIFGEGSFEGPISKTVLGTIQMTMQSKRYNEIESHLGKTITTLKKINLVFRNLNKNSKYFKKDKEQYQKYKNAVYAIKQVLKFAAKIYRSRKVINRKVLKGLNSVVHEEYEYEKVG